MFSIGKSIGKPIGKQVRLGSNMPQLVLIPEYQAVYDAMPVKPPTTDAILQNAWMTKMVDRGYFAKAEYLDFFATDKAENSLINWANPSLFTPQKINSPVFTKYEGWAGKSTGLIKLNYNPSVSKVKVGQNNICLLIGVGGNLSTATDDVGGYDASNNRLGLRARLGANAYFKCNNTVVKSIANSFGVKYYGVSRNNASTYDAYLNKAKTVVTAASSALPNVDLYACGSNENGTIKVSGNPLRFVFKFSYLTQAEIEDVWDITDELLANYHTNIIGYDNYIVKPNLASYAVVPLSTPDGSGETCHPSVVSFASAWNGYKYWMANTPYPDESAALENPCIWASNDGSTWVVPAGLTNPVVPKPSDAYNADSEIFFDSASNKMYLIWKNSRNNPTKMISSSDGITWTNEITVLNPTSPDGANISPSLIKIGAKYYIYYLGLDDVILSSKIKRVSCDTIDGTYGNIEEVNVPSIDGYIWWHFDITYINGYYWLSGLKSASNGYGQEIYVMKSSDGINFTKSPYATVTIMDSALNGYYRPTLAVIEGQPTLFFGTHAVTNGVWGLAKINVDLL